MSQLAQRVIRLVPHSTAPALERLTASQGAPPQCDSLTLVRWLLTRQNARGGQIKSLRDDPHQAVRWSEVPAEWWIWRTILSVPWSRTGDHISLCEARARSLAVSLRMRDIKEHRSVHLHLLDSQANLAQVGKGRTNSRRMSHVHRLASATLLAAGSRQCCGYTSSEANPADKPSRDRAGWGRHRAAMRRVRSETCSYPL